MASSIKHRERGSCDEHKMDIMSLVFARDSFLFGSLAVWKMSRFLSRTYEDTASGVPWDDLASCSVIERKNIKEQANNDCPTYDKMNGIWPILRKV